MGAIKPKGINGIDKLFLGHICLKFAWKHLTNWLVRLFSNPLLFLRCVFIFFVSVAVPLLRNQCCDIFLTVSPLIWNCRVKAYTFWMLTCRYFLFPGIVRVHSELHRWWSTWVHPRFLEGFVLHNFSFMCMSCRSLFALLSFFFWPLCCLSLFDLRILITLLVSSNYSFYP